MTTQADATRIKALTQLPENWDSYGAHPTTQPAAELMFALLTMINGDASISATVEGGITAEWRHNLTDWTLMLEFDAAGDRFSAYLKTVDREWEIG